MKVFENDRIRLGLWKSDVFVKDKQNVNIVMRIMKIEVRVCIKAWSDLEIIGIRVYLKMGYFILQVYIERDLIVRERVKFVWVFMIFLFFAILESMVINF